MVLQSGEVKAKAKKQQCCASWVCSWLIVFFAIIGASDYARVRLRRCCNNDHDIWSQQAPEHSRLLPGMCVLVQLHVQWTCVTTDASKTSVRSVLNQTLSAQRADLHGQAQDVLKRKLNVTLPELEMPEVCHAVFYAPLLCTTIEIWLGLPADMTAPCRQLSVCTLKVFKPT